VTREELEADLRLLPDVTDVQIAGNLALTATVVSRSFEGQDDAARQAAVWSLLRERHEPHHLLNVEHIFTKAPGE
jgi:stress-induced morphogen